jgi:hypothetical protein
MDHHIASGTGSPTGVYIDNVNSFSRVSLIMSSRDVHVSSGTVSYREAYIFTVTGSSRGVNVCDI